MRIESDDILKYITDNTIDIGSDLDLFSWPVIAQSRVNHVKCLRS